MLTGPAAAGRAAAPSRRATRPRSCAGFARQAGARPGAPRDRAAGPRTRRGCRAGRRTARAALPRPDADGQGLPAAGGRRRGRCRAGTRQGPDADDPALTSTSGGRGSGATPGELKNLLRNQAFVAGIGNAYSDEILYAARLAPFRKRSALAAGGGRRAVRGDARGAALGASSSCGCGCRRRFENEVRDFLHVHSRAARPARGAARRSARWRRAGSSRRTAAAASADPASRARGRRVARARARASRLVGPEQSQTGEPGGQDEPGRQQHDQDEADLGQAAGTPGDRRGAWPAGRGARAAPGWAA